ncbi:MAG: DNA polymerase/3'-5' exonuclease PolX [Phycisphaerales bacterium]|jgi:DNA polymerase (family 10)|nr:DNA polymerase/3'-5' exonuclease PolX [Phycisphaerales bacterium]MDP6987142.1 DNA polymerase/3'-5' exonuclease PolX [Phycisphaerales bacterium]
MTVNQELAGLFHEMATLLEITGANQFRINAHSKVAGILEDLPQGIGDFEKPSSIAGIGKGSAAKIAEYLETGRIEAHDALLEEIPDGLLEVMAVPGLGPKTVRLFWQDGGITDIASLKAAIDDGSLELLPRMGAKSVGNIADSIAFMEKSGGRMRLGEVLPLAESIEEMLGKNATRVAHAGSLRRGRDTVGDIDLLAVGDAQKLAESFCTMPGVTKVLARGDTKCSVRLERGMQVDLRIVEEEAFGAAMLYFTGSKDHNVQLRERAQTRSLRLNEYGLYPDDGGDGPPQDRGVVAIAARTEEELYANLDLPWQPPEVREGRAEMEQTSTLELIEVGDIKSDLHCHTTASDGQMSIEELAAEAMRRGYHTVAVTDHSKSSAQAGGLDEDRLARHIDAIREVDAATPGIRLLAGSEVDILADGRLDYEDDVLATLDIVVASPHVALRQSPDKATKRLLRAIEHPLVHIIGHPTGRLINARPGLEPDMPTLVAAAAERGTALEVNSNSWRLDLRDTHVRAAVDGGAWIAIDTDAHAPIDFDQLRYGIMTARRGWLNSTGCINCMSAEDLTAWLAR